MAFGTPKYSGDSKKKTNYFKLERDKVSVFRIIPPYGSLTESGAWRMFYRIHFGYRDSQNRLRPFQSCWKKNYITKMVEVDDPATRRIEAMKSKNEELANLISSGQLQGDALKKAEIEKENCQTFLRSYNVDQKWYLNVVDLAGKVGVLPIGKMMMGQLDNAIKDLMSRGINPISADNGRFFSFLKTGGFGDATARVEVYKESVTINGEEFLKEKKHIATAELEAQVKEHGADLAMLYPKLTPEQIEAIVQADLVRDYRVIESILNNSRAQATTAPAVTAPVAQTYVQAQDDEDDFEPENIPYEKPASYAQNMATRAPQAPTYTHTVQASAPTVAPTSPTVMATKQEAGFVAPKSTPAKNIKDLSNEEFLKMNGF